MDDEKFEYTLKKIAEVAKKKQKELDERKSCEHDWGEVCWTDKSIIFGCTKCGLLKLEHREEKHEKRIRDLELHPPNVLLRIPLRREIGEK